MNKRKKCLFLSIIASLILTLTLLTGCSQSSDALSNNVNTTNSQTNIDKNQNDNKSDNSIKKSDETVTSSKLKVHFIDVGQADSILIQDGKSNMLIDAGNNADANTVVNYLKKENVSKLDYIIGTHPHEDHIGALDDVIKNFDIGKIYMPKITHNTKTFKDVVNAVKNKGLIITNPTTGEKFNIGNSNVTILAPNSNEYEDLNNYSIVVKLNHGKNNFLFTGDAEDISEKEMINKGFDLKSNVLKVGHHGSSSSTTTSFLNKVNPKYAVIMAEKGNSYGHPHKEIMDRLKSKGIKVYRTDENGTIVATSDGNTITFNTKEGSYSYGRESEKSTSSKTTSNNSNSTSSKSNLTTNSSSNSEKSPSNTSNTKTVYYTPKGKSYHTTNECRTLSRSKTILSGTLQEAINSSHSDPCDVCN